MVASNSKVCSLYNIFDSAGRRILRKATPSTIFYDTQAKTQGVPCNNFDGSNNGSCGIGSTEARKKLVRQQYYMVRREHMSTTLVNDLLDQTAVVVWINLKAILSSLCDITMV